MTTETFASHGVPIPVEIFAPATAGKHPAVVVAYGTEGMNAPFGASIQAFAGDLASKGYFVLIPHYFERTRTGAGLSALEAFPIHREAWLETLDDALTYTVGRSDVDGGRVGLLGFSMGGHLALRRAKTGTGVQTKAVVEFFAPITMPPFYRLGGDIGDLPPVQIHHGDADHIVPAEQSRELEALLKAAGKHTKTDYELYFYPGEGHGFRGDLAVRNARERTADFFSRHLSSARPSVAGGEYVPIWPET